MPRQRRFGRVSGVAGPSGKRTRITTLGSLSISPKAPRSTWSEKPDTMAPSFVRKGSAAWPTRGMTKKNTAVTARVAAEAASERPRSGGPSHRAPVTAAGPGAPTRSASPNT